jgi:hypothetical protein
MTCAEFQEHLDPFFDNELGLAEAQKIQQHIEQCSACEAIYASRLAVREALQKPEVRFTPPVDLQGLGGAGACRHSNSPIGFCRPWPVPRRFSCFGSASPSFPLQTDRPAAF